MGEQSSQGNQNHLRNAEDEACARELLVLGSNKLASNSKRKHVIKRTSNSANRIVKKPSEFATSTTCIMLNENGNHHLNDNDEEAFTFISDSDGSILVEPTLNSAILTDKGSNAVAGSQRIIMHVPNNSNVASGNANISDYKFAHALDGNLTDAENSDDEDSEKKTSSVPVGSQSNDDANQVESSGLLDLSNANANDTSNSVEDPNQPIDYSKKSNSSFNSSSSSSSSNNSSLTSGLVSSSQTPVLSSSSKGSSSKKGFSILSVENLISKSPPRLHQITQVASTVGVSNESLVPYHPKADDDVSCDDKGPFNKDQETDQGFQPSPLAKSCTSDIQSRHLTNLQEEHQHEDLQADLPQAVITKSPTSPPPAVVPESSNMAIHSTAVLEAKEATEQVLVPKVIQDATAVTETVDEPIQPVENVVESKVIETCSESEKTSIVVAAEPEQVEKKSSVVDEISDDTVNPTPESSQPLTTMDLVTPDPTVRSEVEPSETSGLVEDQPTAIETETSDPVLLESVAESEAQSVEEVNEADTLTSIVATDDSPTVPSVDEAVETKWEVPTEVEAPESVITEEEQPIVESMTTESNPVDTPIVEAKPVLETSEPVVKPVESEPLISDTPRIEAGMDLEPSETRVPSPGTESPSTETPTTESKVDLVTSDLAVQSEVEPSETSGVVEEQPAAIETETSDPELLEPVAESEAQSVEEVNKTDTLTTIVATDDSPTVPSVNEASKPHEEPIEQHAGLEEKRTEETVGEKVVSVPAVELTEEQDNLESATSVEEAFKSVVEVLEEKVDLETEETSRTEASTFSTIKAKPVEIKSSDDDEKILGSQPDPKPTELIEAKTESEVPHPEKAIETIDDVIETAPAKVIEEPVIEEPAIVSRAETNPPVVIAVKSNVPVTQPEPESLTSVNTSENVTIDTTSSICTPAAVSAEVVKPEVFTGKNNLF